MLSTTPVECPRYLLAKARGLPAAPTAVVNAGSLIPLQSAKLATEQGLITPVLVGDASKIIAIAKEIEWDLSEVRTVATEGEENAAQTAVALARSKEVASLMKGDIHTEQLLKAVIDNDLGLRTGRRLSHVFHMTVPHSNQALCITDAVINVLPTLDIKLDIARNVIDLMHALDNPEPKIALLSATEIPSPAMPSSLEADELVRCVQAGAVRGAIIEGPFAFDNAVSPEAARLKGLDSTVAGHADVLLVPNIETGNALFKMMVYFMSAAAAGIVLGAKVPIALTSRADPVAARLAATALASIYASKQ